MIKTRQLSTSPISPDSHPALLEATQQNNTSSAHFDINHSQSPYHADSFVLDQDHQRDSRHVPDTPSYNGSNQNSPHSVLSDLPTFDIADDLDALALFENNPSGISIAEKYDHTKYSAPNATSPLTVDEHFLPPNSLPLDSFTQNLEDVHFEPQSWAGAAGIDISTTTKTAGTTPNTADTTTQDASEKRRKQPANFVCPVPGCGSTFTRHFNLKGHLRLHGEEKPYQCKWPGCGKNFARQHDCKRHEQLHLNARPYPCDACGKNFARMEALDRHWRSEEGSECIRRLESYLRCEGCKKNVTHTRTHELDGFSFTEGELPSKQELSPNSQDTDLYASMTICEEYKAHCRSPGSFSAFGQAWKKLPPELSTYVLDYLESPEGATDGTARLALVSKAWSQKFRPRLFDRLELRTAGDVLRLERILRSSVSAWLCGHITGITFSGHTFSHSLSVTVLQILPLCTFVHALGQHEVHYTFLPHIQPTAPLRYSLRTVTTLHLSHHRFLSLRHVLRVLASILSLRDVQFREVTWPGSPLSTTEDANNICTGSFLHVRSVHMLSCTDNLVIPAWIFASTSTGHPFVRRAVDAPLPTETSAVINIVHKLLGDSRIDSARFRTTQRDADGYAFIGSLRTRAMSELPYALRQTLAEVAVRSARDEAPVDGSTMWSIREIALAEGLQDIESPTADYMGSRDWAGLASALLDLLQLERFHVLCGHARTKPEFADLQGALARAIDPRLPVNIQYNDTRADARLLVPALFGISETDEGRYCVHESELPCDPKLDQT
ncbi:C2H2-type zinc finger protein [Phanerochaete sordida]|uniref:C2H2-type zinc finger protein n=1 Tax=Phanerochaete sordida TaxID=48140 RepID=A0A9P3LD42_9APHY|nr:C2H2-type zinc finger protein [Phanerochaete sordida]